VHVAAFPQVAVLMTWLLLSRITMYHGVVVTSWLAVAVSVTETPVATLVALAASVTESAGAEVQVTVTGEEVALTVVTPSCVPTIAWYITDCAVVLATDAVHDVPVPQVAMTLLLLSRITMYHGVVVTFWLAVAVSVTEVLVATLVALAASVTESGSVQATVTVAEVALTVVVPSVVPTTAWYVTEVAVALVTGTTHTVPVPQVAMTLLLLSRITMYHGVVVTFWLAVAVSVTGVLGVTLVALAASVTENAGPVQATVTVPEVAWGVAPAAVPTTAWYVTEVAVALVTDAVHVVPVAQNLMTLPLLSRITMYHGVNAMSWLAVAVRMTAVPRLTLAAVAASVTE
jgi:hypothetical protein